MLASLPPFSLVERGGAPVTLDSLRGHAWVADFIFTRCAGICPVMTGRLARLRKQVPIEVRFVSFTVDPEHDTPEVLHRYADLHGASGDWLFVTGAKPALYQLATQGFKLAAMELPPGDSGGPFLHSGKLVLVDAQARVRGYFDSDDEVAVKALAEGIGRLR